LFRIARETDPLNRDDTITNEHS